MKKFSVFFIAVVMLFQSVYAAVAFPETISPSAVLMERDTGSLIFEKNSHQKLPPASVTKVMTLLLVMEALEGGTLSLDEMISVSEHAASMGGSQVFLSPNEQMSVNDLLKATVIASGNDSAVALAEAVAGSEEGFVSLMNERAKELGMNDTTFKNCTGLDAEGHLTSAHDIAIMARELIKYDKIKEYSTTWMDSLRDGAFTLANTNKLIRTYKGITGLKTGSTGAAKYCLAATAERNGMELIATIMAAPSSKERFADASKLLDFGFANFALYNPVNDVELTPIPVILGEDESVVPDFDETPSVLVEKAKLSGVTHKLTLPESINPPIEQGEKLGTLEIFSGDETLLQVPIIASNSVKKLKIPGIFSELISIIFMR